MKDKYYTPDIEEFYIGFEYEMASVDNNWRITSWDSKIINSKFNYELFKKYPELYRVKYLDKDDLEDIGFVINEEETKSYVHCLKGKLKNNIEIWYANAKYKDKIYVSLKSKHYNGNLKIRIKNKSELVKIMNQCEMI